MISSIYKKRIKKFLESLEIDKNLTGDYMIFGTCIISFSMLFGYLIGNTIGALLHIDVNVGGGGFSIIIFLIIIEHLKKRNLLTEKLQTSFNFWRGMYIPVVVAMAASQDVFNAISKGLIAVLAGSVPVLLVVGCIKFLFRNEA